MGSISYVTYNKKKHTLIFHFVIFDENICLLTFSFVYRFLGKCKANQDNTYEYLTYLLNLPRIDIEKDVKQTVLKQSARKGQAITLTSVGS